MVTFYMICCKQMETWDGPMIGMDGTAPRRSPAPPAISFNDRDRVDVVPTLFPPSSPPLLPALFGRILM